MMRAYDFMGHRRKWFSVSGALLLIGIISLLVQGLNLGVDFTGGMLLELDFEDPVTIAQVQGVLTNFDEMQDAQVQRLGDPEAPSMRIRSRGLPDGEQREQMYQALRELAQFEIAELDPVSPVIGQELTRAGLTAIGVALLGMVAYITLRFQFRFAVSAMAALLHDSLITLGLFSLLQVEIDTAFIAAILTIVGYSVNDTIVVFDRVRENLKYRESGTRMAEIVNKSINEILSRSVATSVTTFVAVAGLYLFGGESIRNFTLALMLGVLIGTYSSIFIASPIWLSWQEWKPAKTISRV